MKIISETYVPGFQINPQISKDENCCQTPRLETLIAPVSIRELRHESRLLTCNSQWITLYGGAHFRNFNEFHQNRHFIWAPRPNKSNRHGGLVYSFQFSSLVKTSIRALQTTYHPKTCLVACPPIRCAYLASINYSHHKLQRPRIKSDAHSRRSEVQQ